jgi:hypothetical protein
MATYYKHTQFGKLTVSIFLIALLLFIISEFFFDWHFNATFVFLLILILFALFYSLTVEITDEKIHIKFGVGLIKKTIKVNDVVEVRQVRNPWYYGWGIRWFPGGWLYNVSGLDAVELVMTTGKKYRIGTDEPEKLFKAIQSILNN